MGDGRGLMTNLDADAASLNDAIVGGLRELVALIDSEFRIVGVNANVVDTLGRSAEELIGMSALDLIVAHDQERAALIFGFADQGAMPGSAPFGVMRADGSTVDLDVSGSDTVIAGRQLFTLVGRPTYVPAAMGSILDGLLAGDQLVEVIEPVLDFFSWREMGTKVAVSWRERNGGLRSVSTGLAEALAGHRGDGGSGPWAQARRTAVAVRGPAELILDESTLALAHRQGLHNLWIEPIPTSVAHADALVTVWTSDPTYPPDVHAWAVKSTKRYVNLALQWNDRARRLDAAAHRDELTGLANRRAFFDALSSGSGGGTILYADLDGFKSVNDRWGHAIGDALLVGVGRRLVDIVGDAECVARLGGDEFAVVLRGATAAQARIVAERVRDACLVPFELDGVEVTTGISVGFAHNDAAIGEATLDAADHAQYADKHRRTGQPRPIQRRAAQVELDGQV